MYAAIGYGGIQLWKIMPKIREDYQRARKAAQTQPMPPASEAPSSGKAVNGIVIDGMDNCLVKLSRCCNPLPGDEIIGFITRGFGVSIHKRSCTNVPKDLSSAQEPERWIQAHWAGAVREDFKTTLEIVALDRGGLLADVTQQLFNMRLFIHSLNSRSIKEGKAIISATITVHGKEHLQTIMDKLSSVKGTLSVNRI